jgi:hypothetical protein
LNRLISPVLFLGTVVRSSLWPSMTRSVVSPSSMVTVWRGVAQAGLDALAGDLDAAATGDLPLDSQARLRQKVWPGEAHALQAVPLAGRDSGRAGYATGCHLG